MADIPAALESSQLEPGAESLSPWEASLGDSAPVSLCDPDVRVDSNFGALWRAERRWEHPSLSGILLGRCHAGNSWKPRAR